MAARKLQQEMEKTFKKVAEGREAFQEIYDKIIDCENQSQKEKFEEQLKREIKKLQRHRDQIKTWAASNDIKDKKPLQEQRRLIENEMEKFKAVEKEMKTKAFSKEGLQQATKQDPKEQAKHDASEFLTEQISKLNDQIETLEAEDETLNSSTRKGKKDSSKQDRLVEVARLIERHKWHQGRLELANRALENGSLEPEQIMGELKEEIEYYVNENQGLDFMENEEMYDVLGLDEEGGVWGMSGEVDRVSSHDDKSTQQDEALDDTKSTKAKSVTGSDAPAPSARRPSNNFKSPLPALATLHAPSQSVSSTTTSSAMKPAPAPTRPPGETLQYASAAKVAAASEKTIAPLPPPPTIPTISPLPAAASSSKPASVASPVPSTVAPVAAAAQPAPKSGQQPGLAGSIPPTPTLETSDTATPPPKSKSPLHAVQKAQQQSASSASPELEQPKTPAADDPQRGPRIEGEVESIYHLPPGFQELIQSFDMTRNQPSDPTSDHVQSMLAAGSGNLPDVYDTEKPRNYRPGQKYATPSFYPSEPVNIIDDPVLYQRIDTDTLFFLFYYRQGTYLQYQAAKALKAQSWRFHKQYQTWFQRHEEPKMISDEFEQGTYRFFDYESTWMNRRKAEFKFAYKFLEDDL